VQTLAIEQGIDATAEQMLTLGIQHFVDNIAGQLQREVIVPLLPEVALFPNTTFTIPQRGEKRELLAFSERTARLYRAELMKNLEIKNPERHTDRIMEAMQRELRLEREPRHIECFDNSNTQGTNPVASCVVFRNGKPSKREYRHFNIKTVVGADDFASMREILTRRYTRLVEEGAELPDLIVVDGGKGQLSSAYAVLCELGLESKIPIVGLAKRLEEVYYPNDPMPYYLSRTGEPLKVMCHIRDEAHRFGITFHRSKRNNAMLHSTLEEIEGVGSKSVEMLFKHFKSLTKIKSATVESLAEVVGKTRAEKIYNHFQKNR
jgi:excinuclease ABC subunit C